MTSVLFVRLSAMGDLVQGLGAVAALHHVRPDWRLTFVTQTSWAPLLHGLPGVHRVLEFERRRGLAGVRRLRRELRADDYDVALDLQGNWKSAGVAWLSGARQRIGAGAAFRQEATSRLLLHRTVDAVGSEHPARCAWELVRALAPDAPFWFPRLEPTPEELTREREAVAALGIDPQRPFRVVVVTDPADPRSLLPRVVEAETRASPDPVLHLFGPAERHLAAVDGVPALRHGHEPRRLVGLGAVVAKAGGLVIGTDQGGVHVLAASGARCLVWFGAQDPRRTGPPGAIALVHPQAPSCSPCRRDRCHHHAGRVCMEFGSTQGIPVEATLPADGRPR